MSSNGRLYVISAPSGAGKTSLVTALANLLPDVVVSVSHTTRSMRVGEIDGKDYFFTTVETFTRMADQGEFLEYAKVFNNFYGTLKSSTQKQLNQGLNVILEIDWQGAAQVRARMENSISVFILPPSMTELEDRLRNRGQDSDEIIARRMRDARNEISHFNKFDFIILNDDFGHALQELATLFSSPKTHKPLSKEKLQAIITELLPNY